MAFLLTLMLLASQILILSEEIFSGLQFESVLPHHSRFAHFNSNSNILPLRLFPLIKVEILR